LNKQLKNLIEVECTCRFWGADHAITPRLVDEIFGDGKQLIQLEPLNTRPDYYVVRIDSKWSLENSAESDSFIEHLEEIYDAIEDQFGRWCRCEEEDCDCEEDQSFPVLSTDCGSGWFPMDWPAGLLPGNDGTN